MQINHIHCAENVNTIEQAEVLSHTKLTCNARQLFK